MKRINIAPLRQLSAHLHTREIAQKSYQAAKTFDAALVDLFELIRQYSGNKPIKINSAVRDYIPYGGVADSAHLRGNAFDLKMTKQQLETLKKTLLEWLPMAWALGLRGFGIYTWGVHIDTESQNIKSAWGDGRTAYPMRHWSEVGFTWLSRAGSAAPNDYKFVMSLDEGKKMLSDIQDSTIVSEITADKQEKKWWQTLFLLPLAFLIYKTIS